jgi:hypothetical protein
LVGLVPQLLFYVLKNFILEHLRYNNGRSNPGKGTRDGHFFRGWSHRCHFSQNAEFKPSCTSAFGIALIKNKSEYTECKLRTWSLDSHILAPVNPHRSYDEQDLRAALEKLRSVPHPNISQVADEFGIPRKTLSNRYSEKSKGANQDAHEDQQHLSKLEEEILCMWLEHWSDEGMPFSRKQLRSIVRNMCGVEPSPRWYRRFLAQHPNIRLGKPSGIDPKRAQAFNRTAVQKHFQHTFQRNIPILHGSTDVIIPGLRQQTDDRLVNL